MSHTTLYPTDPFAYNPPLTLSLPVWVQTLGLFQNIHTRSHTCIEYTSISIFMSPVSIWTLMVQTLILMSTLPQSGEWLLSLSRHLCLAYAIKGSLLLFFCVPSLSLVQSISPLFIFSTPAGKTLFDKSNCTPLQAIHILRWYGHHMTNWTVLTKINITEQPSQVIRTTKKL